MGRVLPPSADEARTALEAVAVEINTLERLCVEIDAAFGAREWARLDRAIADSRKAMHGLENAMAEALPYRDEAFDRAAFARLQEIYSYRHERLEALRAYHDEIGNRLRQISRWKSYARSMGTPRDAMQRSSLIDGLR